MKKLSKSNKDIFLMLAGVMLADYMKKQTNAEKLDEITPEEKESIQKVIDQLTSLIADINGSEQMTEEQVMEKVDGLGKKFDLLANAYTVSTQGAGRKEKREVKRTLADAISEMKLHENKGIFVKLDDVQLTAVETNPTETILKPRDPFKGIYNHFTKSRTSSKSHRVITSTEDGSVVTVNIREKKPTLSIEFGQNEVSAATYAGIYRGVTDEDLEDFNWLATFVRSRAKEKMNQAINLACYTLLNGSATAYANTAFQAGVKSPNYINAINAVAAQLRDEMGEGRTGRIIIALNPLVLELTKNQNNDNGTPILTNVGSDVVVIGDGNITGKTVIGWVEDNCHISNYVTMGEEWGYSVKTLSDESVVGEWETDENSLRIRERDIIFAESSDLIVKGDLDAILTDITKPAAA
jgi:hypothetical protein